MYYKRFEELPVWIAAIDLAARVLWLTESASLARVRGLKGQLDRAVVSISNNIAEGFDRGTNKDLIRFIHIARGSTAEVRSMLALLNIMKIDLAQASEILELSARTEEISKQLGAWAESLKRSPHKGVVHQTDEVRRRRIEQDRRSQFLDQISQHTDDNIRRAALRQV